MSETITGTMARWSAGRTLYVPWNKETADVRESAGQLDDPEADFRNPLADAEIEEKLDAQPSPILPWGGCPFSGRLPVDERYRVGPG